MAMPEQTNPSVTGVRRIAFGAGTIVLAVASLAGCAKTYTDYTAFIRQPRPIVTSSEYRLCPPDQVTIASKIVREINGHSETIRPDGKITLPLLGSIFVAGRTCEEVSAQLKELAQEYYEGADVSVRVVGFNSKKIFVFGEVARAGPYPYDGANTVLETLSFAQPSRLADPSRIAVLRPGKDGELTRRMTIDLDKMVKEGDTTLDAVLEEGDILYVPANPLAAVGLAIQQVLLPIQPAAATVQGPADISLYSSKEPYTSSSNK